MSKPTLIGIKPKLTESQEACVEIFREALEQAEQGQINTCAIVVCLKGGFASVMAGNQAADLYMACGELQAKIMDRVTNAGRDKFVQSGIVPVGYS